MTERPVRIESGSNADGLRIYIRDEASGVMLAGITLDAKEVWDVFRGSSIKVGAIMTDHFDRVGKTMTVDSVAYGRDDLKASTYDQMLSDAEQMARADRPGWDEYEARRRGGLYQSTVQVVMRRWE